MSFPDANPSYRLLIEMLSEVYTDEGVSLWLKHAAKQGWTLEEQLQRAEQLITGAFA